MRTSWWMPHLARRSLVALDELGRGTATLDGAAIASAVLEHMARRVGCRGLFATHYHHLSLEHARDPRVAVMHMACAVGGERDERPDEGGDEEAAMEVEREGQEQAEDEVPEVTFLYKLTPGASRRPGRPHGASGSGALSPSWCPAGWA